MIVPGNRLPEFKVPACVGTDAVEGLKDVSSRDFPGKWLVLYTYPKDFTFVCPTEIVEFDRRRSEFEERHAVVLGASTDNEHAHLARRKEHPDLRALRHPLLFLSPALAQALGVLHPSSGVALRATFVIDPEGVVRYAGAYDLDVGRSVAEVLRVLDALQSGGLTACEWRPGERTLTQQMKDAAGAH